MGMAMIVLPLLSLIGLVGFIWLCVVAFKRHPGWGLLVLFLSPITAIVFAIKHWQDSKKPFLVYMGSFTACMAVVFYLVSTVGMQLMALGQSVQADSEQGAAGSTYDATEPAAAAGALDPQQEAELRQMVQEQHSEEAQAHEPPLGPGVMRAAGEPDPTEGHDSVPALAGGAEGSGYLSDVVPPGFRSIPVGQAAEYVGKSIRVVATNGREIQGKLADAKPQMLLIEREFSGGTITFELAAADVETLLVAYQ